MELQLSAITERLESQNLQPFEFEQSSLLRARMLPVCWQPVLAGVRRGNCAGTCVLTTQVPPLAAQYDAVPRAGAAITAFDQL